MLGLLKDIRQPTGNCSGPDFAIDPALLLAKWRLLIVFKRHFWSALANIG
jgi:hypothetical protein